MSIHYMKASIVLVVALALSPVASVAAQDEEIPPCPVGEVSGTVVAVDEETGQVTIDAGEAGLCTVTVGGDFDHPIVSLLGTFFGEVSADNLTAALEETSVWIVCDEEGTCTLASEEDEGAVSATVVSVTENEDGTFTLELSVEGEADPISVTTEDADLADNVGQALETLMVEWTVLEGEDGEPVVEDAGDQIAALHEDGMGFGVIVKLYAIADESQEACAEQEPSTEQEEPCGVTVDELVETWQSGVGMGQLFKEFGKPSMLGVGHVRQELNSEAEGGTETGTADVAGAAAGICNARGHSGNANAHGQGSAKCDDSGQSSSQVQVDQDNKPGGGGNGSGKGGGNGGGKGNGGKGNGGKGNGGKGGGNGKGGRP